MPTKTCTTCTQTKPIDQFSAKKNGRYGVSARCKACDAADKQARRADPVYVEGLRESARQYNAANRDAVYAKNAERNRQRYAQDPAYRERRIRETRVAHDALRLEVYRHYCGGEPACQCCGETHWEFLQLDHINGDGSVQRAQKGSRGSAGTLYWVKRNGFPEGYRVLCSNCNFSLGRRGYCPHQRE